MGDSSKSPGSIVVNRGFPNPGYTWSPFVTKLEFRLRHSGVSHVCECGSLSAAPKGKIPYIEVGHADGTKEKMGDTSLIIQAMENEGWLKDVNGSLSEDDRLADLGVRALLEDKLYFYRTRELWVDNYYTMRDHILSQLSYPMRVLVGYLIYRKHLSILYGQGTMRYDQGEVASFRRQIWETLARQLLVSRRKWVEMDGGGGEEKQCFYLLGGEGPTEADFTLFGFIIAVMVNEAGPESKRTVGEFEVLEDYARRIHGRFFGDYEL
ncbi:hypothetical protein MKZ38_005901 [Zalerion maritima]|uniref:Thioredoxin-like fold domain-containing protein n=1 Tax=Zalerion maritima TaxID=339359 RepID=A0AAD5RJU1_9PEZI|nr:hypothetical protein MKZ38_005901 [Zalerion maritima]